MIDVKIATPADAGEFLKIYEPYVIGSEVSFEYILPTVGEFSGMIGKYLEKYPFLKLLDDGRISGYAYASPFRERRAYDWSAETTIYLDGDHQRRGCGTMIYNCLFEILKKQGIPNAVALIVHPYAPSENFHKKLGFERVALLERCAYKNGKWQDLAMYQKKLVSSLPERPDLPVPFRELPRAAVDGILSRYSKI